MPPHPAPRPSDNSPNLGPWIGVVITAALLATIFVVDAIFGSSIWQNILFGCNTLICNPIANLCRRKKAHRQIKRSAVNQEARENRQDIELRAVKPKNPRRASPRPTINDTEVADEREDVDLSDLVESPRPSTEDSPFPEPNRGRCLTRHQYRVARPDTPDLYSASPRASVATSATASATASVLTASAPPHAAARPAAARSASVISFPASSIAGTSARSRSIDSSFPHHRDSVITTFGKQSGEVQTGNQPNRHLGRDILVPAFKDAARTLVEQNGPNGKFAEHLMALTGGRSAARKSA